MQEITKFINTNETYIFIGLAVLTLLALIVAIFAHIKLGKIRKKRESRLEDGRVGDIIDCLSTHNDNLSRLESLMSQLSSNQAILRDDIDGCLSKVGIVRFNAFDDVGGEQSFALALLDSRDNGVVISGLYGREDSRIYAKSISNGESERNLSTEEKRALDIAKDCRKSPVSVR